MPKTARTHFLFSSVRQYVRAPSRGLCGTASPFFASVDNLKPRLASYIIHQRSSRLGLELCRLHAAVYADCTLHSTLIPLLHGPFIELGITFN